MIIKRQRMPSCKWQHFLDPATVSKYAAIHDQLCKRYDVRLAAQGMTYLWNFVVLFNEEVANPGPREDLGSLNGAREGLEHAQRAWDRMRNEHGIHGRYLFHVQTLLAKALSLIVVSLAHAINPAMRVDRSLATTSGGAVMATRSQVRQFDIHSHGGPSPPPPPPPQTHNSKKIYILGADVCANVCHCLYDACHFITPCTFCSLAWQMS